MTDKKKMSIEDILASCRGGEAAPGTGDAGKSKPASESAPSAEASSAPPAAKPASGPKPPAAKPGSMSVADILAAARTGSSASSDSSNEPAAAEAPPAPAKPTAKPATAKPGAMNVSDILAAARGAGSAPAAPKSATPKPAASEAKPKPAPKAPAAKSEGAAAASTVDTSSILAAARKATKAGPMSKAEAAALPSAGAAAKTKPALLPMPEKPAYAVAKASPTTVTRRGVMEVFFGSFLAIGFTTLCSTSLLWVLGLARFMFPNILIEPPSRFRVGFPGDFAPGSVSDKFKAQFGIWVVNAEYEGQLQIVALKTVCTHLGCTPNWLEAEQKYKCPCHGSGFYKDGINFEGPAPRPLERYAIQIAADGQLEIDKSKTFQQELGQWSNPSSFVIV